MARETREIWKKRVERWVDSGLTAKDFAAEIGVNVHTLTHWKWRLSTEAAPRLAAVGAPSFVEVVAPLVGKEMPAPSAVAQPLELVLPGGLVVRVPSRFDADVLRRLVDVLGGR
ncbi:MAG: hypothetical protein QM765_18630 [Myxococcales bacterium]